MNAATPHPLLPPADGTLGYVRIGDVLLDSGVLLPQAVSYTHLTLPTSDLV